MVVRSRAPLRLSFAGGGTDVAPFPETEGGAVLSATIDRYAYGSLTPRADQRISVHSLDLGMSLDFDARAEPSFDGRLDLVKAAVRRLGGDSSGFDLLLRSSAPPGSGLGSSSTMLVALVGLLREHHRLPLTDYEVAELAYQAERVDLRIRGGHQDHYAATFGGFNFIEFGERVIVNPLRVKDSVVDELQLNLLLCWTGTTRQSARIIEDQTARLAGGELETLAGLRAQKELAVSMKSALLRGELSEFGSLLGEAWKQKKRMSPLDRHRLHRGGVRRGDAGRRARRQGHRGRGRRLHPVLLRLRPEAPAGRGADPDGRRGDRRRVRAARPDHLAGLSRPAPRPTRRVILRQAGGP